ncbi:metalloregulator ArsR/SmtB family transcription factor [Motilimonas cestriensis]|uniref:Metalloregulator ArsR/SmtB family transcription factor n=1 Tax=Motilimonas cestriensis TaxID=2742685 RepID=A0ABS8WC14_9GAMM|nr:metalloregulator ArsR/SmtB family transcription factor [Motilimonas cestriensis]MCE2595847.1 metalloregulator ArsR/SmtB family transcription factor [Motilimonas cestriensis]
MFEHEYLKLLGDETRICCLLLIYNKKVMCVCELTETLQLSQPKISRHLALLRQAGILTSERKGQWVYYQLAVDLPPWFYDLLQQLIESGTLQKSYHVDVTRLNTANVCCD